MNTTGERVKITPELLDEVERASAQAAVSFGTYEGTAAEYVDAMRAFMLTATPPVVLTLVARIRELDSELREVYSDDRLHYP